MPSCFYCVFDTRLEVAHFKIQQNPRVAAPLASAAQFLITSFISHRTARLSLFSLLAKPLGHRLVDAYKFATFPFEEEGGKKVLLKRRGMVKEGNKTTLSLSCLESSLWASLTEQSRLVITRRGCGCVCVGPSGDTDAGVLTQ